MDNNNLYMDQHPRNYKKILLVVVFSIIPIVTFFIGYQWGTSRKDRSYSEAISSIPTAQPNYAQENPQKEFVSPTESSDQPDSYPRFVIDGKKISFAELESLRYLRDTDGSYDFFVFRTEESENKYTTCMNKGVYDGVDYKNYGECNLYDVGVRISVESLQPGDTVEAFIDRTRNVNLSQEPPKSIMFGKYDAYYYDEAGMGMIRKYIIENNGTIYVVSGNYFDSQVARVFEEVIATVNFL